MLLNRWYLFRRFPGLIIVSLVPLLVWSLHRVEWLEPFDGWLRDRFVQYAPLSIEDTGRVLVVQHDADAPDLNSQNSARAIDELLDLGAKLVVLLQLPDDADASFVQALATLPVVVGRYQHKDMQANSSVHLERWPQVPGRLPVGIVQAPQLKGGVSRYIETRVSSSDPALRPLPLAVLAAVRSMQSDQVNNDFGSSASTHSEKIYIDFQGFPQSFPRIDLARLLNDELSQELISDKVVVLANGTSFAEFGIPVPSSHGVMQVPTAMWQGLAIDALLSERQLHMTPAWFNALLLVFTGIVALILLPQGHTRSGLRSLVYLSAFFITLTIVSLWWLETWMPITAVLLCLIWVRVFSSRIILRRNKNALWRLSTHQAHNESERRTVDAPWKAKDPWPELTHLARQILPVRRMICLEVSGADHRLTISRSFLCESGDLIEQRRDLSRSPWKDMVDDALPMKISELPTARPLLVENDAEDQYVIPLRYANDLCGFWVLCVDRNAVASIPRFREVTQVIANEIAAQLYRRQGWQQQQRSLLKPWLSYLSLELSDHSNTTLSRSMFRLEDRLSDLEDLFDQLEDATLCFDMFGRVEFVNQAMTDLLTHTPTDAFASSPLQFVSDLTNLPEEDARDILQSIVLKHDEVMLSVHDKWSDHRSDLIARIHAIHEDADSLVSGEDVQSDQIKGIVFQVVNVEAVTEPYRLKNLFAQRLDYSIRNRLTGVQTATALLQGPGLSKDLQQKVLKTITRDMQEITNTLKTARPYLHEDATAKTEHIVMDTRSSILSAIEKLSEIAKKNQLQFDTDLPDLPYLVRGNSRQFREGFSGVLELLIDEAYEGTKINVSLRQTKLTLQLNVTNTGFGIPAERLNSFLFDDDDVDSEVIRSIRGLSERIIAWGGELRVDSAIGTGITFNVMLPKLL